MGCRQKNQQVCQNSILLLHKNILRKKFTMFFWSSNGFFQILAENLGQVCRNCIVRGQTSHSMKTNVFRKANSFCFRIFSRKFLALGKEISACLSKLHSTLSQEKIKDKGLNIFFVCFFGFSAAAFRNSSRLFGGNSVWTAL